MFSKKYLLKLHISFVYIHITILLSDCPGDLFVTIASVRRGAHAKLSMTSSLRVIQRPRDIIPENLQSESAGQVIVPLHVKNFRSLDILQWDPGDVLG